MGFIYTPATTSIANGDIDLDTDDFRVVLLSTNTTADSERDAALVSDFATLDEFNGTGYTANGQTITGRALVVDAGNNRTNVTASTNTWVSLGAGTRPIQCAVVVKWGGTLATSQPIACFTDGGFPLTPSGADVPITWNASGMFQVQSAT